MKAVTQQALREAAQAFDFGGAVGEAAHYGAGHINDTYAVARADGTKRFILQRINTDTFIDPAGLMENICGVTEYLRRAILAAGGDPARETLHVIPAKTGAAFFTDSEGGAWRAYTFIEDTICLQKVETEQEFDTVARTFGHFQRQLAAYPAKTLHETIAHFHDTPARYENLERAVQADPLGRAASVAEELAFVRARKADCRVLSELLAAGGLPLRVTHNDTKLNNVLIDRATGRGICVIDLDTVMPGLSLHDFGDSIRFGANDCAEDEPDQSKVHFSLHLYQVFTQGFLAEAGEALTETEKACLPWGAKLMTLECGMRFLTDYLEGDHYFKISRPAQNLDRARTQFALVKGMEAVWAAMQAQSAAPIA